MEWTTKRESMKMGEDRLEGCVGTRTRRHEVKKVTEG